MRQISIQCEIKPVWVLMGLTLTLLVCSVLLGLGVYRNSSPLNSHNLQCGMWDLVPRPGIEPGCLASGAQSLSYWPTIEIPLHLVLHLGFVMQFLWPAACSTGAHMVPGLLPQVSGHPGFL